VVPPLLLLHTHDQAEQTSHTVFLPLLTYVAKKKQDSLAIFLGLGYYKRTADKGWGGFAPLVFHSRSAEHRKTTILPLLFFEGENKVTGSRYATMLPWFFYWRDGNRSRLLVTPLRGSYENYETGEKTTLSLLPLFLDRDDPVRHMTVV